jgi:NAD dependent epimerase/dehydratase
MKVLVTGADGFIGSHLAELLVSRGNEVVALVQYNSFGHTGWLGDSTVAAEMDVQVGDVRDLELCHSLVRGVNRVFHLAALIGIPYSYVAPNSYIETNVIGTSNICQAALVAGVDRVVVTSTSEVYGTARYTPMDELHPRQAQSPYSASKIGADVIAASFQAAFDLPVVIARPFNTYGPRQSLRAVIPSMIEQLLGGTDELYLGDTTPKRDLTYVQDTCRALVDIASADSLLGQQVNVGSGASISIGQLAETVQEIMGTSATVKRDEARLRPAKSEVFLLEADTTKLTEHTGFKPQVNLKDGLRKTIEWFRGHRSYWNVPGSYSV